jgi:hypothetical protein
MTRRSSPLLRVVPPTLEPGPVLLHQLAELSASSSPSVRPARYAAVRALAGAATVAVIGATTWAAGAAPGSDLTAGSPEHRRPAASGVPSAGVDVGAPAADVGLSVPGSPWSPGLPGTEPSDDSAAPDGDAPGRRTKQLVKADPVKQEQTPAAEDTIDDTAGDTDSPEDTGPGKGHENGHGKGHENGHGNGNAYGHQKSDGAPSRDTADVTTTNRGESHGNGHGYGHLKSNGKAKGHQLGKSHQLGKGHHKGQDKGHKKAHGKAHGKKSHGRGHR